ncbi:FAD-dependent monooxygenase [Cupriavidus basilensis]
MPLDVAIIGAGPVGLMIANILGLQGVRVVLVEKLDQIIDYPRAIGLDDEALRVFQSVGLADALLPHTTPHHWMRFAHAYRPLLCIDRAAHRRVWLVPPQRLPSSRWPTASCMTACSAAHVRSCWATASRPSHRTNMA